MDASTHHAIAVHVGDNGGQSADALWEKIPAAYRERAICSKDHYAVYPGVIPSTQHRHIKKPARKTNHVERFNCTLRQRLARLMHATLAPTAFHLRL
jgi:IS1 family transposase